MPTMPYSRKFDISYLIFVEQWNRRLEVLPTSIHCSLLGLRSHQTSRPLHRPASCVGGTNTHELPARMEGIGINVAANAVRWSHKQKLSCYSKGNKFFTWYPSFKILPDMFSFHVVGYDRTQALQRSVFQPVSQSGTLGFSSNTVRLGSQSVRDSRLLQKHCPTGQSVSQSVMHSRLLQKHCPTGQSVSQGL